MARVIIVEDEYSPRQMLLTRLKQYSPELEVIAECENAEDALIDILRLRPDLIFLDIQMSGRSGLWLAEELMNLKNETFTPPDIIFTTGYTYSEYLLKAFELAAIDYLVKPVGVESLEKAISRYNDRSGITTGLQNLMDAINDVKLLKFKSYNSLLLLRPDDIAYIKADRDYACMYFANGTKEDIFERLGEIEKKLPADIFLRTGKSIIVNRKYIRKITDVSLQLVTPSTTYLVEISRSSTRMLKNKL